MLAVPGAPTAASLSVAEEVLSIARSELPGLDARIGFAENADEEGLPALETVLASADAAASEASGAPSAIVVPLLAGPDSAQLRGIRQTVLSSGSGAELTDVLGPHPLLAEGVHVRLSESGLARADRARLFTVATAADGIVLTTVGGEEAVQTAGITGMLLSARLAVPVLAAALDEDGAVAATANRLLEAGSRQLALAPCLIGPEIPEGLLESASKEAGCPAAEPLGAYPAIGKLVLSTYMTAAGLAPQRSGTQGPTPR